MKEKKNVPPAVDNEPYLLNDLKDPEFAAEFLNTAIEEYLEDGDIQSFNAILGYIVKAGNVSQIAKEAKVSRSQIYRIINGKSEATLSTAIKLLKALGYNFQVKPVEKSA